MKRLSQLVFIVMSAILVMGWSVSVPAETEPNNDIANANGVALNSSVDGSLNSVDSTDSIDCFKITVEADGILQVGVVPTSDLNVELLLSDSNGVYKMAQKNDKGNGGAEAIVCPNLRAGTYYVIVKIPDTNDPVKGDYSVSCNFEPVGDIDPEPNDAVAQAVDLPLNDEVRGHIGYYGSNFTDVQDFYTITIPKDGKLEVTVYPDGTGNLSLGLYDSVTYYNRVWANQKGKGESEKVTYNNLLAGTYIILVQREEGYCSYNLTSLYTPNETVDKEPNDSIATAEAVAVNDTINVKGKMGYYGNLYQDDNDYYKATIPAYGKLTLASKMDFGESLNVGFQLWDSSLRYLGNSNVFDGLEAGTYYVRMYRNSGYGSYTLTFTFEQKEAPAPVAVNVPAMGVNDKVGSIPVASDSPEYWCMVSLPEDGSFTVKMQFDAAIYIYMSLFYEDGITKAAGDVSAYWTTEERWINVPNLRKGNYKIRLARADGGSIGTLTTEFTPVTKLDNEPNDEYSSLTPIEYNRSYVGHLGYNGNGWMDRLDLYAIDLPEDGALNVTYFGPNTSYNYITLYNKSGNTYSKLSETSSYWTTEPRSVGKVNVMAGQYLFQISRADGYGPYDFSVEFTPNRSNDPETHGDDWTRAKEIALGEGYVGHIGYDSNFIMDRSDYYKVTLPEDGSFYATFQADKTSFPYWRIYYADFMNKVAETNSYWTEETRTIGASFLRAGTYYISIDRVEGYGTYQFFTEFKAQPIEDLDSNDYASQAKNLELNQLAQGALGYRDLYFLDAVDWFRVTVPVKDKYKFTFQGTHTNYFYYEIYAPNMITRYSYDSRYWNTDPYTREIELEAGTYYIKCWRADGYGPYNIILGNQNWVTSGTLTGKVTTKSGFPLAEITVQTLNRSAQTDAMGVYTIENVPTGPQTVTFTSGTKYYPETVETVINAGQTTTVDRVMSDSNKTAPLDVSRFYVQPASNYMHLFWSASVSPDVADGGGYKLYVNEAEPIVLGNVLYYRFLGFMNGYTYNLRVTVYDKYGNESAGKTLVVNLTGEIIEPTPTPTLQPGQPTPTPTTLAPQATPTPTNTPKSGATPTPTSPVVYPTPTPGEPVQVQPDRIYEFDQASLDEDGWVEIPGGFTGATPGAIIPYYGFPSGKFPSSADQRGAAIVVKSGEVTFLRTAEMIDSQGYPVLIRCVVKSAGTNASIAVGALKGSLETGDNVDGTIGYSNVVSAASFVDREGRITAVFRPDTGAIINPFVQVAGTAGASVNVWIDRVDVFVLRPGVAYSGDLFGNLP